MLKLDFDPIIPVPASLNISNNKNNIDRTNNSNSILSLANLRRMTTGFGSFTSGSTANSTAAGGGTRELLEQKARWINDIAAVCQRNILIYEEKLRMQEEAQNGGSPTTTMTTTVVQPDDIDVNVDDSPVDHPIEAEESNVIPDGEHLDDEYVLRSHFVIFDTDRVRLGSSQKNLRPLLNQRQEQKRKKRNEKKIEMMRNRFC